MEQHDVDVSPPANIMTFRLGLTKLTFDLFFLSFAQAVRKTDGRRCNTHTQFT